MLSATDVSAAAPQTKVAFNSTCVWIISIVTVMGELHFGCDWIVISGADRSCETHLH